jgi:hypothetical protein
VSTRFVFLIDAFPGGNISLTMPRESVSVAFAASMWLMTLVKDDRLQFTVRLSDEYPADADLITTLEELQVFLRKHKLSLLD